jgi:ATP-binding cassette subfamily B protein
LDTQPTVKDASDAVGRVEGHTISIRHLSFRYPDRKVNALTDVSIEIPTGYLVGLVGRTGAGKSTLLRLLIREFEPPRGKIWIGGHDVRQIALPTLRGELVSYISQSSFLFSTTMGQNIGFPLVDPNPRVVETAAKRAQLWDLAEQLPHHLDTVIGERGVLLSGGQRQRTALARALSQTRARILILDDAMSAVDTETESAIVAMLEELRGDRTILVASHRIAAVQTADLILVFDHGEIIEAGTHESLLHEQGFYARLAQIQSPCEEGLPL